MTDFLTLLQQNFGFKEFRKGQLEAIQALLQHKRLLCVQPTGYGKSLLYQFPSCLLPGITLVISPLLALMRDQIEHLNNRFHISAASLNSDQSEEENGKTFSKALAGKIKVLFVSPEQLDNLDRFEFLVNLPLSLVVIDEAHCISTWGHDFRPSYRQIVHFIQALKNPEIKILGLTATADERAEKDILKQLSCPHILRESMNRPNIHLSATSIKGIAAKLSFCKTLLTRLEGSGLIYCATRENTELVAEYLSIVSYHAGLLPEEKRRIQTAFTKDEFKVISATTALGMGIDKSNLRFVIHFDIPGSITAYYQEVGRCGRDGLEAQGILLYDPDDKKIQEYFIDSALPSREDFELVLNTVRSAKEPPNLSKIKQLTGLHPTRVTIILAELIEQQFLKKEKLKNSQVYTQDQQPSHLDLTRYSTQHLVKTEELNKMISYAEQTTKCRMEILRNALGDKETETCGHCDICLKAPQKPTISEPSTLQWLLERPIPIAETRSTLPGLSCLDGKLRTPLFIQFMKQRTTAEHIEESLISLLKKHLSLLDIAAVIPLPSKTWKARNDVASLIANHLGVKVLDLLSWESPPEKRQGELLNNDQRHHNVHEKMRVDPKCKIPLGTLLLLDDYIGSGSTMKEAARALSKKTQNPLIPFTIASVKWKLGKPGFI